MEAISKILKLDFLKGSRSYIAMGLFAAVCIAGWTGLPLEQYGIDLMPDDPASVPTPGGAIMLLLGWLGLYEKVKSATVR